jgi:outer membrane protein assembly factor BamB
MAGSLLALSAPPALAAPADSWQQVGGDPAQTSALHHRSPITAANASSLTTAWTFPLTEHASRAVVDHDAVFFTTDSTLDALSEQDGTLRWSIPDFGFDNEPPIVRGGTVYALDSAGVFSFRRSDGRQLHVHGVIGPTGDALTRTALYVTTFDGHLLSLDPATLAVRFDVTVGGRLSDPSVSEGLVVIISGSPGDTTLTAFDAATGAVRWSLAHQPVAGRSVAITRGVIYAPVFTDISQPQGVAAYRLADGAPLWGPFTIDTFGVATPAVSRDLVYTPGLVALIARDQKTGDERWRSVGSVGTPTVAGGLLFANGGLGHVVIDDARTGVPVASVGSTFYSDFGPTVAGDHVIQTGNDAAGHWGVTALALP